MSKAGGTPSTKYNTNFLRKALGGENHKKDMYKIGFQDMLFTKGNDFLLKVYFC